MTDEQHKEPPEEHAGSLRQRVAGDLLQGVVASAGAGERAATELGKAAQATALQVVTTGLGGERVLVGHVLGMRLSLPASHLHGPREVPALLYLFADALAIRPTDDAPMSAIPLPGLHMVLPPAAVAHWVYKAGRIEHANLDLVEDEQRFADSIAEWTVDDFAQADPKLEVHTTADLPGPLQLYEHLAYAHLSVPVTGTRPVHLKSDLPVTPSAFAALQELFARVSSS
ncbi:MAG: hypothetical protein M0T77_07365 [Actinomycetota bacterium]|nr:hypothetical protein [Actinomycetota bacterium]